MPSTSAVVRGLAAAQRPNAPSTCTHASFAFAAPPIASKSSHAPVFTLPACAQTIVGPGSSAVSASASAAASIAPFASAGISTIAASPRPSRRSDRSIVPWRSAPASTRTGGAPCRPSRPTSQPCWCSTHQRPAASPTVLAPWPPVANPTDAVAGIRSSSFSQRTGHVLERERSR